MKDFFLKVCAQNVGAHYTRQTMVASSQFYWWGNGVVNRTCDVTIAIPHKRQIQKQEQALLIPSQSTFFYTGRTRCCNNLADSYHCYPGQLNGNTNSGQVRKESWCHTFGPFFTTRGRRGGNGGHEMTAELLRGFDLSNYCKSWSDYSSTCYALNFSPFVLIHKKKFLSPEHP